MVHLVVHTRTSASLYPSILKKTRYRRCLVISDWWNKTYCYCTYVIHISFSFSTTFQMHNFQNIIGHICIPDISLLPWTLYVRIRPWKVSSDHQSNLDCTKFASRILFSGLCSSKGLEHVENYWRTTRKLKPSAFLIRILWLVGILEEFHYRLQNFDRKIWKIPK